MKNTIVGKLWNDASIEIVSIDGLFYALYGWNGEYYTNCWKVDSTDGLMESADKNIYCIKPIYREVIQDDFEIIGYKLRY